MKKTKKIIFILTILIVITVTAIVFLLSNVNSLIESNRDKLESVASKALGTDVKFGSLEASFIPLGVSVKDVQVGDNNSNAGFNNFFISLKLLPLLKKTADITNIELSAPHLSLIKDSAGVYLEGLPRKTKIPKEEKAPLPTDSKEAPSTSTTPSNKEIPLDIKLNSVTLKNGLVTFKDTLSGRTFKADDLNFKTALNVTDSKVNLDHGAASTTLNSEPFSVSYKGIVYNLKNSALNINNITLNTPAGSLAAKAKVKSPTEGEATIEKSHFDLSKGLKLATAFVPNLPVKELTGSLDLALHIALAQVGLPLLDGTINLNNIQTKVAGFSIKDLSGAIRLQEEEKQIITIDPLKLSLNNAPITLKMKSNYQASVFTLDSLTANLFAGTLNLLGKFVTTERSFSGKAALTALDIGSALKAVAPKAPPLISGTLNSLTANIKGVAGPDLIKTLNGAAVLKVTDGHLTQINIAKGVLSDLSTNPLFKSALSQDATQEISAIMAKDTTVIKSLDSAISIQGHTVKLNKLSLVSDIFTLEGNGTYHLRDGFNLKTTIYFSKKLSASIASRVKELKSALDNQGRLAIPLKIDGTPSAIKLRPDTDSLLKLTAKTAAKEGVKKLLDNSEKTKGLGSLIDIF
ncbi:MAG: AsmA-like C-terminal region-containing protein [Bdellovibrionota bacterium]|jgi:hypothetical protein